ncbi:TerB family tellurite resistance protein [Azospirillum rugosum]|uniref:Tellurite resistance protein B-like protein n=1 Tax=Azospirillum rugosum TaxID=416170 RepID=A0ABS4SIP3_9PROT|nr:TerB family tellurite resistance protein [Azospirillum rugosum]MBP2292443.1 putative tellurite resistance protein B-like protein [Azospirillum rugosum]MDQ0526202.1 putative tellurite resistance protein B-like protein [Azospirillum rugosum]
MGLFDRFKGSAPLDLNPRRALVVSLIYCMGSDGEIDPEEVGHLISVLGRNATREELDRCFKYARSTPAERFLEDAAPNLNEQQRLCILLNMIDSAMADGEAEQGERDLIARFQQAFGFDDAKLGPYFQALMAKNDRSVLGA